jgi:hypothetical protein
MTADGSTFTFESAKYTLERKNLAQCKRNGALQVSH